MTDKWISEATEQTFEEEVLERSHRTAVLVDFWAAWCGPCRALTPALEAAVASRGGDLWLVKVDVEQSPELAARYGVQGVPAVKAFVDGEVRSEFVGAQDRVAIDDFINALVPSAEDAALEQGRVLLASDRPGEVENVLLPAFQSARHRDQGLLLLARAKMAGGDYLASIEALDEIPEGSAVFDKAHALRLKLELEGAGGRDDLSSLMAKLEAAPDDLDTRWALAGRQLSSGNVRDALTSLLELLKRDRRYREDGARRAMLAVFEDIGVHHDLANEFRRQMQIYM